MERAIITGATGAVGMALIKELIEHDIEVLVFCRKDSKRKGRIPEHPLVSVRYCSLPDLCNVQNDTGKTWNVFYHLAWDGTVGAARDDMQLQNQNVGYALDAVQAAGRFGCDTFIGAGSQAEYGRVEGVLKPETPAFPENGYGIGKLCAGQMTRGYARQLGLRHVWARILSVYGPYDGMQSMVMSTIDKLYRGETPHFTKGEQMWDYLYSGDAANALRLMGENGADGAVYVLGSGNARPLADYIMEIRDAVNPAATVELGAIPYQQNQVMYLCGDISRLSEDTGWEPVVDFGQGIGLTFEAFRAENDF